MKFGIIFANTGRAAVDPAYAALLGRAAEDAGFESLWTVEHVVVPIGYESAYPYSRSGRMAGDESSPIPDPLVWLTWVAAHTATIRLATGIVILPQRNPLVLAKAVATLDVLSGGRVELGVGVGWLREEFDALGVPFADRAAMTDEHIEVLRTVWREEEPSFEGRFTRFGPLRSEPRPVQPGGPPIVVGGHTPAAARRAGRAGDGFFPARAKEEELVPLLEELRRAAVDAGRDPDTIEVTCGGAFDVDGVRRFQDLGVDRIVVPPLGNDEASLREGLERFAEQVITKV